MELLTSVLPRHVSHIGAKYASRVSPLEDSLKGLEGKDSISWTDELSKQFKDVQTLHKSPSLLTIPVPTDHLIMRVDASPVNSGIGATLFLRRDEKTASC